MEKGNSADSGFCSGGCAGTCRLRIRTKRKKATDSGKSGEQDKEKKEMAMGRYLEEDVTLPEGCGDIADMTMLEDGSLRVC